MHVCGTGPRACIMVFCSSRRHCRLENSADSHSGCRIQTIMCCKIGIFVRLQIEAGDKSLTNKKKDGHTEYVNLELSIFANVLSKWKNNFNNAKFSIS